MNALSGPPKFIIFLDFDGVLHPTSASEHERFKPESIQAVNRILDELEGHGVLSTAWRMDFSIDKFNAWFKGRIISSTPVHELDLQKKNPRFHEIIDFLESNGWLYVPWIAIDDKQTHFPPESPAYITNAKIGLTNQDAENIIKIGKSMKFAQRALIEHLKKMRSQR